MEEFADPDLVAQWVRGWTIARETAPPVAEHGGWRVDVGWPDQKQRYVFAAPGPGLTACARAITEPWIYLKVCAPLSEVRDLFPHRWVLEARGFMMTHSGPPPIGRPLALPYVLELENRGAVCVCTVVTPSGEIAAIGRVTVAGDMAVFDRIETHADHRRLGLGSAVMHGLHQVASERGSHKGVLVATEAGHKLYETLGWAVHSPYTSAVIPEV